jgi:DNA-binding FadR family transcriptional regulator
MPTPRLRINAAIAQDIGIRIVSGQLKPGDHLEGELIASSQLNVSRTAYREALRILTAKGLVLSRTKTGTRVNDTHLWHLLDPDVLGWIFGHEPDPALVADLFELRRIVEPEAASLAAERRTDAQLARMAEALKNMAAYGLATEEGRAADQAFHAALLDAAGNAFLCSLTSGIGAAVAWTTIYKQRHNPLRRDPLPDHQRVYDAVAAGDKAAAREMMIALVELAYGDFEGNIST